MASVQRHAVVQCILPRRRPLVTGVRDPPVALQQHGRAEVLLAVPPVGWAGGGAAGAEDALVQAVELAAVGLGLAVLAAVWGRGVALEIGLDGLVLLVELGEVGHEVLDDVGVRERVDAGLLGGLCWDAACMCSQYVCLIVIVAS